MREIKYKVWNEELEEMYVISKEKYLGSTGIVDPYVGHEKAVWLQFTGLTDVNGREIYEGDIVRQYSRSGYEHIIVNVGIGVLEYSCGAFVIRNINDGRTHFLFYSEQEVLGNIYQHKHLLKEKN